MVWVAIWALQIVVALIFGSDLLNFLLGLALLWPGLMIGIKRRHDRNRSGWWLLIGLIPFLGRLWLLIELGFQRGTSGPNRFGPDPLAAAHQPGQVAA